MKKIIMGALFSLVYSQGGVADGVGINALRVIYPANSESVSTTLRNTTQDSDYLTRVKVTSEVDGGQSPFTVVPPVFRLKANSENNIRIIKVNGDLPTDRESLFWLNMQSVPMISDTESASGNINSTVQVGLGNIIKLIYRPDGLPVSPDKGFCLLQFASSSTGLTITNPSPYYVSFASFTVNGKQQISTTQPIKMIAPFANAVMSMPSPQSAAAVEWKAITDLGGIVVCHGHVQ